MPVIGFDTGPGNCLMDSWILQHSGDDFDLKGLWGRTGKVLDWLLELLLKHPFLPKKPPKSTGKEEFNLAWLESTLDVSGKTPSPEDVQATLNLFTAKTIRHGLLQLPLKADQVFLCGGGACNLLLVENISNCLTGTPVQSTHSVGLEPLQVEAAAFAWLAHRTLNRLPGSLASVTGARRDSVLGGIYWPD